MRPLPGEESVVIDLEFLDIDSVTTPLEVTGEVQLSLHQRAVDADRAAAIERASIVCSLRRLPVAMNVAALADMIEAGQL